MIGNAMVRCDLNAMILDAAWVRCTDAAARPTLR
jgi:hypothetical protein